MKPLRRLCFWVLVWLLSGCATTALTASPIAITRTPLPTNVLPPLTREPRPSPAASRLAAATEKPASAPTLWIEPGIDGALSEIIQETARTQKLTLVPNREQAAVIISTTTSPDPLLLTERVYAVADRFATWREGMRFSDLQKVWRGQPAGGIQTLIATDETVGALRTILGAPAANVRRVPAPELVDALWQTPHALALVPFDELVPRLLALPLDGANLLDRRLDLSRYPLVVRVYVEGDPILAGPLFNLLREKVEPTNRDPNHMTTLVMTGVTAMGRFTADAIDRSGDPAFATRKVADILSQADITHISNEIPFVENCPPNLVHDSIILCSKPEYIEALKLAGTDIVGLTGNHAGDFGYDNYLKTLALYEQNGIQYYAGGRNASEARRPLIITHNGNRMAFLGANSFGPRSYWATPTKPGTNGYDPAQMREDIATARKQADLVFVEFQADEVYSYKPDATNVEIFRRTIADGADVVTGVQNHHPAAIEFRDDGHKVIFYGLGNFSFDQMYNDEVRQGLIPRHLIYKGRLLQIELLTTMLEAYAQPRWATPAERERILRGVFGASGFAWP